MNRVKVIPKENQTVYNPATKRNIAAAGELVIMDSYWHRRLQDNEIDVLESSAAKAHGEQVINESLAVDEGKKTGENKVKPSSKPKQKTNKGK